ncbi:biotin--protein ligase [Anopheles ziemanni]|uniref:biotin--protein ligase n=1 Tax=Anopheles coustani TaxID=139045 RepID=UPI002658BCEE|nr:biotin--protein ligase [Anopheles coustani]XP_058173533.1 biotin--protein ligase [Anopheles ziemanni]
MLFTLMYLAMTIRTSSKFRVIKNNLRKILTDRYAVSFYTTSNGNWAAGSPDASPCTNVTTCIWYGPEQRGCLLYPVQRKSLSSWISVPETIKSLQVTGASCDWQSVNQKNDTVHLLVTLEQSFEQTPEDSVDSIMLTRFGRFLAWNRSTRGLQVLLETDTAHLFQLFVATFGQNRYLMNAGRLKLIHLESVETYDEPKPFEESKDLVESFPTVTEQTFTTDAWLSSLFKILPDKDPDPIQVPISGIQPDIIASNDIKISLDMVDGTVKSSQSKADVLTSGSTSRNRSQLDLTDGIASTVDYLDKAPTPNDSPVPEDIKTETNTTSPVVQNVPNKLDVAQSVVAQVAKNDTPTEAPPIVMNVVSNGTHKNPPVTSPEKPKTIPAVQKPVVTQKGDSPVVKPKTARSLRKSSFPSSRLRLVNMPAGVATKPPNILVHSDSSSTMEYVIATLNNLLEPNTYTIYPITTAQAMAGNWQQSTVLIIVAGTLDVGVRKVLLDYFLHGGIVFSLCSDLLDSILPDSKTAEIRERELVSFSYRRWKQIKMLHHIFCYQLSPAKKQFSLESEETATLMPVSYVDAIDLSGKPHSLTVEILAQEETWNTPSILEAHNRSTGGRAIFSQIHLELDPSQFQTTIDGADSSLQNSNQLRYEILSDLLGSRIGLKLRDKTTEMGDSITYKNAFFLGKHEAKVDVLGALKDTMVRPNVIQTTDLTLQFCGKSESTPGPATETHLPVMIFHCPEDFSTVEYFENLTTNQIGRIGIYAPIMTSSMLIVSNLTLAHGFMVISRYQTKGKGRNNNQWLSPPGCAMFSLQLHIPMNSPLGQRLSMVQHLVAVSIVTALLSLPGYEKLDLGLKWPNDIYAYGSSKVGGSISNTQVDATTAIMNVGVGLNLNNSKPTICVNDIITQYNTKHSTTLPLLSYEKTFALIFNKLEELYDRVQREGVTSLQEEYCRLWLHQDAEISMIGPSGESLQGTIVGIDDYGFLVVKKQPSGETVSVHPDGNSFDMMQGLIIPKYN